MVSRLTSLAQAPVAGGAPGGGWAARAARRAGPSRRTGFGRI